MLIGVTMVVVGLAVGFSMRRGEDGGVVLAVGSLALASGTVLFFESFGPVAVLFPVSLAAGALATRVVGARRGVSVGDRAAPVEG